MKIEFAVFYSWINEQYQKDVAKNLQPKELYSEPHQHLRSGK